MKHFLMCLALLTPLIPLHAHPLHKQEIYYLKNNLNSAPQNLFTAASTRLAPAKVTTNPEKLLQATQDALDLLLSSKGSHHFEQVITQNFTQLTKKVPFKTNDVLTNDARKTLQFIIYTLRDDKRHNRPHRMLDSDFLNKHFNLIAWKPDTASARKNKVELVDDKQIRTTKYAVFKRPGRTKKTRKFNCALYGFTSTAHPDTLRFRFTKQQVVQGALNKKEFKGKVEPLVWVTRDGLEDALLQGTLCVQMPDSSFKMFNVDKNNGIAYDRTIKNTRRQKRYWYFKEIKIGNENSPQACVLKNGGVALAADIYNIGMGKIVALCHKNRTTGAPEIRLGVIVDTGGAFTNNLYQVDQFAGIFDTKQQMYDRTSHLPKFAQAFILVKKEAA